MAMLAYSPSYERWIVQKPQRPTPTKSAVKTIYQLRQPDYVDKFNAMVKKWRLETAVLSSIEEKVNHKAFQEILKMGRVAVPLIVEELRRKPDFLFLALASLAPESDVVSFRGSPSETVSAWLRWAERNRVSY